MLCWYRWIPHSDKTQELGESFMIRKSVFCRQAKRKPLWYYEVPES